jgi:hypothetical protein
VASASVARDYYVARIRGRGQPHRSFHSLGQILSRAIPLKGRCGQAYKPSLGSRYKNGRFRITACLPPITGASPMSF